jgi:hypothetical protein
MKVTKVTFNGNVNRFFSDLSVFIGQEVKFYNRYDTGDSFTVTNIGVGWFEAAGPDMSYAENVFPKAKAYKKIDEANLLIVYKDGNTISIGTDYRVSFNNKDYESLWDVSGAKDDFFTDGRPEEFRIKILNPDPNSLYVVQYQILPDQKLNSMGKLVDGELVSDEGSFRVVCVLRQSGSSDSDIVLDRIDLGFK